VNSEAAASFKFQISSLRVEIAQSLGTPAFHRELASHELRIRVRPPGIKLET
jgi:hypothetical protein